MARPTRKCASLFNFKHCFWLVWAVWAGQPVFPNQNYYDLLYFRNWWKWWGKPSKGFRQPPKKRRVGRSFQVRGRCKAQLIRALRMPCMYGPEPLRDSEESLHLTDDHCQRQVVLVRYHDLLKQSIWMLFSTAPQVFVLGLSSLGLLLNNFLLFLCRYCVIWGRQQN